MVPTVGVDKNLLFIHTNNFTKDFTKERWEKPVKETSVEAITLKDYTMGRTKILEERHILMVLKAFGDSLKLRFNYRHENMYQIMLTIFRNNLLN